MVPNEIQSLVDITQQIKIRDITKYAGICRAIEEMQKQIGAISADKHRQIICGADLHSFAKWQRWSDTEIEKLRTKIQETANEKEAARKLAANSQAKVQVLELLLKKARSEQIQKARRRAEQDGRPPDA
ncbi:MAG: hypothetical protein AAED33_01490 [Paracoccaceae bacterium]|jgi:gamma-glutamyl:cysteine ligase YbdK (ATP-grasp superfamily)